MFTSMFLLAFHGFLRPGEISGKLHNITFDMCTIFNDSMQIDFSHFKHSAGVSAKILVPASFDKFCPRNALLKYISFRGCKPGYLFCDRHDMDKPVSYYKLSKIVRLIVKYLCINGVLTPHSFRIGAATWAARQGCSLEEIMRMGRWASDAVKNYIRIPSIQLKLFKS